MNNRFTLSAVTALVLNTFLIEPVDAASVKCPKTDEISQAFSKNPDFDQGFKDKNGNVWTNVQSPPASGPYKNSCNAPNSGFMPPPSITLNNKKSITSNNTGKEECSYTVKCPHNSSPDYVLQM